MARSIMHRTLTALSSVSSCQSRVCHRRRRKVAFESRRHAHCGVSKENPFLKVSEEVREAIETQKPVVALETTIYTHGGSI